MKLSPLDCKNAKPRDKAYKMTDGHGLSLLVRPTGSKLWQWAYRYAGKQKTLSIGQFPVYGVREARDATYRARQQLDAGVDPMRPAGDPLSQKRFREVAEEHFVVWKGDKVPAHVERVWGRLEADAFPEIGDSRLVDIKPTDVVALVRKVEQRGALDVSRRLRQKISEIFGFAIAMGYCDTDPAAHVGKVMRPKPSVEHMARVPLKEMPKLVASLRSHPIELVRIGLQFTLLTACRSAEVRGARWSEIKDDRWTIPAERMKMNREHIIPLSTQALELVERLRKHRRGAYLFPGPRREVVNANWLIYALYDLNWRDRQTVHGFRGLFSTWANEKEWSSDVVERCLAHVEENKVRGAYNSAEWLDRRAALMQAWADAVDDWSLLGMLE